MSVGFTVILVGTSPFVARRRFSKPHTRPLVSDTGVVVGRAHAGGPRHVGEAEVQPHRTAAGTVSAERPASSSESASAPTSRDSSAADSGTMKGGPTQVVEPDAIAFVNVDPKLMFTCIAQEVKPLEA